MTTVFDAIAAESAHLFWVAKQAGRALPEAALPNTLGAEGDRPRHALRRRGFGPAFRRLR